MSGHARSIWRLHCRALLAGIPVTAVLVLTPLVGLVTAAPPRALHRYAARNATSRRVSPSRGPWRSSGLVRTIALTFDDLPFIAAASANQMQSGRRITAKIIGTLHSHRAPAVGFVNEGKLDRAGETGARIGLLQQWVDAGLVLGNHTYSHRDFNTATVEQFEDEIVKGEPVTRRLMASREPYPRFFRHPQTHTGDTAAKKEAIERFLASKGYTVAPHAIDTSDFIFNVGYTRALRAGDRRTATRLRDAYLEFAVAATAFAERITSQIFSRDIPQTMLLHANDIGADTLEDLLSRLEARGYEFITLETAMADAAYQTRDTVVTTFGPSWLWRWTKSKSLTISFAEDPDPPEWVMSLYRRGLEGRGRN